MPMTVPCWAWRPGRAQTGHRNGGGGRCWYREGSGQAAQSQTPHIDSDRLRSQSPRRNRDQCKVRYSDGLIDSWDAKGAYAHDNETKERNDAEKDIAHTADGIHWDVLIN